MNNQECVIRTNIIDNSNNELIFYPFSVNVIKCSNICNSVNDSYNKICVPDVVKNIDLKVFNLMSRAN